MFERCSRDIQKTFGWSISDGCPFEEEEDVLDFIKSKAREREARENGAGVTHSGSTEDTMMEAKFTRRIGPLLCPGRQARLLLPQTEPRPSNFVNTINIVVKLLDQTMFPVQARNIIIREFNGQELRFDPPSNVGDLVHKDICIL
ncbi:10349_t:CDS:2 [Rhizophagus irregularis]|nr:10349_t:CDS:2 [Rhizophagus irregularis]